MKESIADIYSDETHEQTISVFVLVAVFRNAVLKENIVMEDVVVCHIIFCTSANMYVE